MQVVQLLGCSCALAFEWLSITIPSEPIVGIIYGPQRGLLGDHQPQISSPLRLAVPAPCAAAPCVAAAAPNDVAAAPCVAEASRRAQQQWAEARGPVSLRLESWALGLMSPFQPLFLVFFLVLGNF